MNTSSHDGKREATLWDIKYSLIFPPPGVFMDQGVNNIVVGWGDGVEDKRGVCQSFPLPSPLVGCLL